MRNVFFFFESFIIRFTDYLSPVKLLYGFFLWCVKKKYKHLLSFFKLSFFLLLLVINKLNCLHLCMYLICLVETHPLFNNWTYFYPTFLFSFSSYSALVYLLNIRKKKWTYKLKISFYLSKRFFFHLNLPEQLYSFWKKVVKELIWPLTECTLIFINF